MPYYPTANQTIAPLSAIEGRFASAAPFSVTAPKASSGLPVVLSIKSGPATISGTPGGTYTVTLTGNVGTVVIAANQPGNATPNTSPGLYNAAPEVTTSFPVSKLPQNIEFFPVILTLTPGAAPFSFTAPTASSGLPVTLSVKSGPATISGNTVTLTGSEGVVILAANQSGNTDYYSAPEVTTSFTVAKLSQSISDFPIISSKPPGSAPFTITTPTASSGLPVTLSVKSGPATISGNTVTLTGATGTVVLAANQSGNADYYAAPEVTTSFTVAKLSQSISPLRFPFLTAHITPGDGPFSIPVPTASSGLPVTLSVKSGPATISGNTVTLTGTNGSVVLAANQAGNVDYYAANEVTTSFKVSVTSGDPVADFSAAFSISGVYFGWAVARQAGLDGHPVRRAAWMDRWLYFYNGLWWVMPATGRPRVVTTADFITEDYLATDWTNLSPTCVTSSPASGGGAAPCPLPYDPLSPIMGPLPISGGAIFPS